MKTINYRKDELIKGGDDFDRDIQLTDNDHEIFKIRDTYINKYSPTWELGFKKTFVKMNLLEQQEWNDVSSDYISRLSSYTCCEMERLISQIDGHVDEIIDEKWERKQELANQLSAEVEEKYYEELYNGI